MYKMELKEFKQLTKIQLYKGDDIISSITVDELYKILNTSIRFINLDGKIINTNDIRIAEPYIVNGLESWVLSQPKDIQNKIKARNEWRKSKNLPEFDSIEKIQVYLNS